MSLILNLTTSLGSAHPSPLVLNYNTITHYTTNLLVDDVVVSATSLSIRYFKVEGITSDVVIEGSQTSIVRTYVLIVEVSDVLLTQYPILVIDSGDITSIVIFTSNTSLVGSELSYLFNRILGITSGEYALSSGFFKVIKDKVTLLVSDYILSFNDVNHTILHAYTTYVDTAPFIASPSPITIRLSRVLQIDTRSLIISEASMFVYTDLRILLGVGSYSISTTNIASSINYKVSIVTDDLHVSSVNVVFSIHLYDGNTTILLTPSSVIVTGYQLQILNLITLPLVTGSYIINEFGVIILESGKLRLDTKAMVVSTPEVIITYAGRTLVLATSSFSITSIFAQVQIANAIQYTLTMGKSDVSIISTPMYSFRGLTVVLSSSSVSMSLYTMLLKEPIRVYLNVSEYLTSSNGIGISKGSSITLSSLYCSIGLYSLDVFHNYSVVPLVSVLELVSTNTIIARNLLYVAVETPYQVYLSDISRHVDKIPIVLVSVPSVITCYNTNFYKVLYRSADTSGLSINTTEIIISKGSKIICSSLNLVFTANEVVRRIGVVLDTTTYLVTQYGTIINPLVYHTLVVSSAPFLVSVSLLRTKSYTPPISIISNISKFSPANSRAYYVS